MYWSKTKSQIVFSGHILALLYRVRVDSVYSESLSCNPSLWLTYVVFSSFRKLSHDIRMGECRGFVRILKNINGKIKSLTPLMRYRWHNDSKPVNSHFYAVLVLQPDCIHIQYWQDKIDSIRKYIEIIIRWAGMGGNYLVYFLKKGVFILQVMYGRYSFHTH